MKTFQLLLVIAVVVGIFTGCATTEPGNDSERPWNAQKGWQHGLPSNINQGR